MLEPPPAEASDHADVGDLTPARFTRGLVDDHARLLRVGSGGTRRSRSDGGMSAWVRRAAGHDTGDNSSRRTGSLATRPLVADASFVHHISRRRDSSSRRPPRVLQWRANRRGDGRSRKMGHILARRTPFTSTLSFRLKPLPSCCCSRPRARNGDTVAAYCHIGQAMPPCSRRTLGYRVSPTAQRGLVAPKSAGRTRRNNGTPPEATAAVTWMTLCLAENSRWDPRRLQTGRRDTGSRRPTSAATRSRHRLRRPVHWPP